MNLNDFFKKKKDEDDSANDPEKALAKQEWNGLMTRVNEIVTMYRPTDIKPEKIVQRMGAVLMMYGPTRSTILSAATFVGVYARATGLTKDQILNIVGNIIDETDKLQTVQKMAEQYAIANAEYLKQQAEKEQNQGTEGGSTPDFPIISPDDGNVH